jgi:hypothetical protein
LASRLLTYEPGLDFDLKRPDDPDDAIVPRNCQEQLETLSIPEKTELGRARTHISDHRHRRLLRASGERPRDRRAAKKRGELSPSHDEEFPSRVGLIPKCAPDGTMHIAFVPNRRDNLNDR